ncbi:hypothetical protein HMPREF1044_1152 [Streptococcus constellatus subsp. constellatus SK53]|uniref:Uncharacterized protein n=1 Tax=Streptococcus constellatus subsp. constellatus SK53 TaxID=1095730 RepID=A0AAD2SUR7_STRCV|nr:hypothetical protein HMPREF1044_1152 [Streptococcus constellatus subsp. constellatus SK53]BBD21805.1 hypothetical protein SCSC_0116 [Streptococcus constellatus subsp. constellatus]
MNGTLVLLFSFGDSSTIDKSIVDYKKEKQPFCFPLTDYLLYIY